VDLKLLVINWNILPSKQKLIINSLSTSQHVIYIIPFVRASDGSWMGQEKSQNYNLLPLPMRILAQIIQEGETGGSEKDPRSSLNIEI